MSYKSSSSCWVFDVDGVLADTRQAVKDAYFAVGVDQPDDVWGLSWRLWLPAIVGDDAPQRHAAKQIFYENALKNGDLPRLAGADLARALIDAGNVVHFVTAASERSACAVIEAVELPTELLWDSELSADARCAALKGIASHCVDFGSFTYIDDRLEGGDVALAAGYAFIHAPWML